MKMFHYLISTTVSLAILLGLSAVLQAEQYIELGPADPMTIDQPRVAVEVYIPEPEHTFGPDISNYWLLDTGAQSILAAQTAVGEMTSLGYETDDTFEEMGIGGSTIYDISKIYNFDFANSAGVRNTLPDVRILSSESANFGSFGGIVGMPAMVNRVTTIDHTAMLTNYQIGVDFSAIPPADPGHRYSVPLQLVHFGHSDQTPPDPTLPVYKPLPFTVIEGRHDGNSASGNFVLDTGAQLSMLSSQFAFDLGLDTDGDGNFDNEKVDDFPLSGAGGSTVAPVLFIEKLVLHTSEGVDLIWTDLNLPVLDIDPAINGIFGNDLLTSGWFEPVLNSMLGDPSTEHGYIDYVHFDFTDSDNLNGTMLLDLNPVYDNVVTVPDFLPGDANGDGVVSAADYASVQANFGNTGLAGLLGDANGDGVVSASDYASVQASFGNIAAGTANVPEPATICISAIGLAVMLRKRK